MAIQSQTVYTNDTVRVKATFLDLNDQLVDPDGQSCTFTSYLEETGKTSSTAAATRESQGVYYYDYLLPAAQTNYIVEMAGDFSGDRQVKRFKLKARFKGA